jgi:uncharacterized protein
VQGGPVDTSRAAHARLHPLAADITDGLWADRRRLNRDKLIPEGLHQLETAGNLHNLRLAAGRDDGDFRGMLFADSDVYKWLEAVGWEPQLAARADEIIEVIEAAQDEDGYLNSYYQMVRPGPRFGNLAWHHELYCCGHLIQAAVAHVRGRGDDRLLAVARRFADHVDLVFGPGRREGTPGHPELETALVELYRLTGERRYLDLAGFFVDQRGHGLLQPAHFGSSYFPDHVPVREQDAIAGHAVRALYLAAGVTDLYLETGEARLLEVMRAQWEDMAGAKTYLTGGLGAHHRDEAFGEPYELPPDRCYGETCAAIASIQWNWRMLLATGEARHADLIERTLYNGFLAGLALDGGGYAYVNPLQLREGMPGVRHSWFPCACCPPNVMRLLASLHHYLATADDSGVQLHQYVGGTVRAGEVALRVRTAYPWGGRVEIEVEETVAQPWALSLRVPGWCAGGRVDGEAVQPGYARLKRSWAAGDRVTLELPMPPRLTAPHPRIDAVRGCLAIERGPLVYCLEGADAPAGASIDDVLLDAGCPLEDAPRPELLDGVVAVSATGRHRPAAGWQDTWPYASPNGRVGREDGPPVSLLAVPYALWGNRGDGPMRVWTPAVRS